MDNEHGRQYRGMENILMDVMSEEGIAQAIFGKIREFYLVYLERILDAANGKIDIVLTGDDFGAQKRTLLAPDAPAELRVKIALAVKHCPTRALSIEED